jgi:hypothetical protein
MNHKASRATLPETTPETSAAGFSYSYEIDCPDVPGEGKVGLCSSSLVDLSLPRAQCQNFQKVYELVMRTYCTVCELQVNLVDQGNDPWYGVRVIENGVAGRYVWTSYNDGLKRVENVA